METNYPKCACQIKSDEQECTCDVNQEVPTYNGFTDFHSNDCPFSETKYYYMKHTVECPQIKLLIDPQNERRIARAEAQRFGNHVEY